VQGRTGTKITNKSLKRVREPGGKKSTTQTQKGGMKGRAVTIHNSRET